MSAKSAGLKSSGNFMPFILQIFFRSSVTSSYLLFTASHLGDSGITSLRKKLTSGRSNMTKRPHHRRKWTVQSYSPGCANVTPI